jgi:hypothetical protein
VVTLPFEGGDKFMKAGWRLRLKKGLFFVWCMTETAALISSPAFSQAIDSSQIIPPITLATEIIAATRYEHLLSELPVSATVIKRKDILNSPGRSAEEYRAHQARLIDMMKTRE